MDELESACRLPLRWALQKPAYVSWDDTDQGLLCLGSPTSVNKTTRLTFNIGWDSEGGLLMALHLPVTVRNARGPIHVFMIIAVESIPIDHFNRESFLAVHTQSLDFGTQSDLAMVGLTDCSVFRLPFLLIRCSRVIMPATRREKGLKGNAKELMSLMRSLSQTRKFDVFCRFDSFAQATLQQEVLPRWSSLATPTFDYGRMYHGRGGAYDNWTGQGLLKVCLTEHGPTLDKATAASALPLDQKQVQRREQSPSPPPPYPIAQSTDVAASSAPLFPPSLSPSAHGSSSSSSPLPSVPPPSHSTPPALTVTDDEFPVSSNEPLILVPCSDSDRCAMSDDQDDSCIAETPCPSRQSSVQHASTAVLTKRHASPAVLPANKRLRLQETMTALDGQETDVNVEKETRETHDSVVSIAANISHNMTEWLYNVWRIDGQAHHHCQRQLIGLGRARSVASARRWRNECSVALAIHMAAKGDVCGSVTPLSVDNVIQFKAGEQVRDLVTWINDIHPGADLDLMHSVVDVAEKAIVVLHSDDASHRSNSYGHFMRAKAQCMAQACQLRP